jgi:hypothetical protein
MLQKNTFQNLEHEQLLMKFNLIQGFLKKGKKCEIYRDKNTQFINFDTLYNFIFSSNW